MILLYSLSFSATYQHPAKHPFYRIFSSSIPIILTDMIQYLHSVVFRKPLKGSVIFSI